MDAPTITPSAIDPTASPAPVAEQADADASAQAEPELLEELLVEEVSIDGMCGVY